MGVIVLKMELLGKEEEGGAVKKIPTMELCGSYQ